MNKRILGLDLGTNSIGWAYIKEGENPDQSSIEQIGVRVNPLTVDEQTNFEKGKPLTTNADRTLKRGARRNLDRFKLRREQLLEILKSSNIINEETKLTEDGANTTHSTWRLRAKAATERIELDEFARVLFAINLKRGYKSSRKAKNEDEGQAIDGMAIAKRLYEDKLTPGQLTYHLLQEGKKTVPEFYRSDLQAEFDKIWAIQKRTHSDILTDEFYKELQGKGQRATAALFWTKYKFNTADIKDIEDSLKNEQTIKLSNREKKRLQAYKWRNDAVSIPQRKGDPLIVSRDEEPFSVKFEKIPLLNPAFKKEGTVTAANASTMNDGAAALLMMSKEKAMELGVKPIAKILAYADAEQQPEWFTTTPSLAVPKAVAKAGLNMEDIDFWELNEAFSVVGIENTKRMQLDPSKVNVNGGAVSLGHPLGASGARIIVTLIHILKQNGARYGAAGICNGGGGASAMVLERI
ncbi:MAG TPA: hypothetical protein PKX63_02185 [Niabella sp.]|nr:hypothetical protein [Niabella sp.]